MNPTGAPTLGDKVKGALKGVIPPAAGGTLGTGEPTAVTAAREAEKRELRHEARHEMGAGGLGGTGIGTGMGMGEGTGALGAGAGGLGTGTTSETMGTTTGVAGTERVISRQEGTLVVDRPVEKVVEQAFVEHRPVAQQVETVTRIVGEQAMEGGTRMEPLGPAQERVVREGGESIMGVSGLGGGGATGTAGVTGEAGAMGGGGLTASEQARLEAERLGRGGHGGAGMGGGAI